MEPDERKSESRFFREAEAAGNSRIRTSSPFTMWAKTMRSAYMAMELLDGTDLKDPTARRTICCRLREVLEFMANVAGALDYAHSNGVVHRDIKPANIMILKTGRQGGRFRHRPGHQLLQDADGGHHGNAQLHVPGADRRKKVDGRADLFSLTVVLYELLTGQKPFDRSAWPR